MGQKVHPYAFRIGVNKTWQSIWFSKKQYRDNLLKDIALRKYIDHKLPDAGIAKIELRRSADQLTVIIHTSKPGIVIGRSDANVEKLREDLRKFTQSSLDLKIVEVRKPDLNAKLIAENVARQIEKRIPYRRACKQAKDRAIEQGIKGIKISVAGRLNGAEIARDETFKSGNVPLHTLRANIDYAFERAKTTYGVIGVKVWLYHGMIFEPQMLEPLPESVS